jgi:hypothetical protein
MIERWLQDYFFRSEGMCGHLNRLEVAKVFAWPPTFFGEDGHIVTPYLSLKCHTTSYITLLIFFFKKKNYKVKLYKRKK